MLLQSTKIVLVPPNYDSNIGLFAIALHLFNYSYSSFAIEQKGMTFDHNFGYCSPLFSSLIKKEGRRRGEKISKNRDQK